MLGTSYDMTIDWLIVPHPEKPGVHIHAHASFLLSNWECRFGTCPGLVDETPTFAADVGCCGSGFYVDDAADHDRIEAALTDLGPEDWDDELRRVYSRKGWKNWLRRPVGGGDVHSTADWSLKSRVVDGACIFANRSTGTVGSTGKIGCAFLHAAERRGIASADDDGMEDPRHDLAMPLVCHQLPLRIEEVKDANGELSSIVIKPWDADEWPGDASEYGGTWWCTDDPDTYTANTAIVDRMSGTLIDALGQPAYDLLHDELHQRMSTTSAMPVQRKAWADPQHRPLIPLAVAGKTMVRPAPVFTAQWGTP